VRWEFDTSARGRLASASSPTMGRGDERSSPGSSEELGRVRTVLIAPRRAFGPGAPQGGGYGARPGKAPEDAGRSSVSAPRSSVTLITARLQRLGCARPFHPGTARDWLRSRPRRSRPSRTEEDTGTRMRASRKQDTSEVRLALEGNEIGFAVGDRRPAQAQRIASQQSCAAACSPKSVGENVGSDAGS
jgi:hypothetical protein